MGHEFQGQAASYMCSNANQADERECKIFMRIGVTTSYEGEAALRKLQHASSVRALQKTHADVPER